MIRHRRRGPSSSSPPYLRRSPNEKAITRSLVFASGAPPVATVIQNDANYSLASEEAGRADTRQVATLLNFGVFRGTQERASRRDASEVSVSVCARRAVRT